MAEPGAGVREMGDLKSAYGQYTAAPQFRHKKLKKDIHEIKYCL